MLRLLTVVLPPLFVLAAALQLNDPDPWLWAPLYLSGAVAGWLAHAGRLPRPLALPAAAVLLLVVAWRIDSLHQGPHAMSLLHTEAGNETLGLAILGLWIGALALQSRRKKPAESS